MNSSNRLREQPGEEADVILSWIVQELAAADSSLVRRLAALGWDRSVESGVGRERVLGEIVRELRQDAKLLRFDEIPDRHLSPILRALKRAAADPGAAVDHDGLADEQGAIPMFGPARTDAQGRIVMDQAEQDARRSAALRAIEAIGRVSDETDTDAAWDVIAAWFEGTP